MNAWSCMLFRSGSASMILIAVGLSRRTLYSMPLVSGNDIFSTTEMLTLQSHLSLRPGLESSLPDNDKGVFPAR